MSHCRRSKCSMWPRRNPLGKRPHCSLAKPTKTGTRSHHRQHAKQCFVRGSGFRRHTSWSMRSTRPMPKRHSALGTRHCCTLARQSAPGTPFHHVTRAWRSGARDSASLHRMWPSTRSTCSMQPRRSPRGTRPRRIRATPPAMGTRSHPVRRASRRCGCGTACQCRTSWCR